MSTPSILVTDRRGRFGCGGQCTGQVHLLCQDWLGTVCRAGALAVPGMAGKLLSLSQGACAHIKLDRVGVLVLTVWPEPTLSLMGKWR